MAARGEGSERERGGKSPQRNATRRRAPSEGGKYVTPQRAHVPETCRDESNGNAFIQTAGGCAQYARRTRVTGSGGSALHPAEHRRDNRLLVVSSRQGERAARRRGLVHPLPSVHWHINRYRSLR